MKKQFSMNAVGVSSLLVIFAVLCLTVFALLSVSTVLSQQRLAQSTRSAVTDYYAADCEAEQILAQLRAGQCPQGVQKNGDIYTYTCPVSQTQMLAVQVRVNGTDYTVLRWQTVSAAQWEAEDKLPVWDGQEP